MNEQNSQSPDEGRLIDYLLNESSPEERAEVERLCSQHADWNKAKTALESTFGLIEDACKQPATEVEGEMQLDANRRQELETLRSDKLSETMEQSDQKRRKLKKDLLLSNPPFGLRWPPPPVLLSSFGLPTPPIGKPPKKNLPPPTSSLLKKWRKTKTCRQRGTKMQLCALQIGNWPKKRMPWLTQVLPSQSKNPACWKIRMHLQLANR